MHTLRYVVIDVFTDTPLAGNQLAVFTNAETLTAATMQALAREMAFSESVFVLRAKDGGHARMRVFTPTRELPFAGHPTLGAAFVLGQPMQVSTIRLETGAGIVPVTLEREGARVVFGWMTQPLPRIEPFADTAPLFAALGVERSLLPVERYHLGPSHVFVALPSRQDVLALRPDLAALASMLDAGVNVFASDGPRATTRVFAPAHGVPEDAATGSAAGPLAVHLARHGRLGFGEELVISQGDAIGRPSTLYARAHGSVASIERVEVGGAAVVVAHGEFRLRTLPGADSEATA
jgi:trans-2,3-dihydro-3-hydroxyanthranilate isomerase